MGSLVVVAAILASIWALLSYYEAVTISRGERAARTRREPPAAAPPSSFPAGAAGHR
jgi:hypothetical protein